MRTIKATRWYPRTTEEYNIANGRFAVEFRALNVYKRGAYYIIEGTIDGVTWFSMRQWTRNRKGVSINIDGTYGTQCSIMVHKIRIIYRGFDISGIRIYS